MKKEPESIWSFITLLLLTGILLYPVVIGIGYVVTRVLHRPRTSPDDYGWRGVGLGLILFGIFFFLFAIMLTLQGETDSILGALFGVLIFGIGPIYIGKKLIIDWT